MDKLLQVKLNGNREVKGKLRGFDQFMNLVLDETFELVSANQKNDIGIVVRHPSCGSMLKAFNLMFWSAKYHRIDLALFFSNKSSVYPRIYTRRNVYKYGEGAMCCIDKYAVNIY